MKEDLTQWASGLLWASESRPGSAGEACGRPCLEADESSAENQGSCDLHKRINLHSMSVASGSRGQWTLAGQLSDIGSQLSRWLCAW